MDKERENRILNAGMKAARDRLSRRPQKGEYPRDFMTLYGWLEDKVFNLYEAICLRKTRRIRGTAGEIIVTVSEIAEFADAESAYKELTEGRKDDEIFDS